MKETVELLTEILNKLTEINENLKPETFTWKLKDKKLIEEKFFKKISSSHQIKYIQMVNDIAKQNNLEVDNIEHWPTEPLRHLFYSSCKWIGIKDGKEKSRLSREIFDIISSKKGKLEAEPENTNIKLFGDNNNEIKLF